MSGLFGVLAQHGEAGGGASGGWLFDPHSGGLVFWTAVTFTIVLLALYRLAWPQILDSLEKREKTIRDALAEAERSRVEAAKVLEEHQARIEKVRAEAEAIVAEGRADKKRLLDEARELAISEGEAIRQRVLRDLELAKGKAIDELKQTSVQLALAIAEKVVNAEVDEARHRKLIDEALASYERVGTS